MNNITKIICIAAALGSFGAANATTVVDDKPVVEINTRGIDLNTAEGQARLLQLTHTAARKVCFVSQGSDLRVMMQENKCFKRAMAEAQVQIAALHGSENQVASRSER